MQQWSHASVNTSERCLIRIPTSGLSCIKPESRSPAMGESSQAAEEKSWMNRDRQPRKAPRLKRRLIPVAAVVDSFRFDASILACSSH